MAVEVEKLYGIVHGAHVELLWTGSEVYLKPACEILDELSHLPRGTRVGIEASSPEELKKLENLVIDGVKTNPGGIGQYWEQIKECCQKSQLDVIFLEDDIAAYKECARLQIRAAKLDKQLRKIKNPDKISTYKQEKYALKTEWEFSHIIKREKYLLQRIKKTKPQIVLLGRGHTDYLRAKPDITEKLGIKFKAYAAEETPDLQALRGDLLFCMSEEMPSNSGSTAEFLSRHIPPNPFVQDPAFDRCTVLAERDSLERRYNAVKTGRITNGERKPDYIGAWQLDIPARGLFELFIYERDDNHVSGLIEDTLGMATFTGNFFTISSSRIINPV